MSYHTEIEYISGKVFEHEKRKVLKMHNVFNMIFYGHAIFQFLWHSESLYGLQGTSLSIFYEVNYLRNTKIYFQYFKVREL